MLAMRSARRNALSLPATLELSFLQEHDAKFQRPVKQRQRVLFSFRFIVEPVEKDAEVVDPEHRGSHPGKKSAGLAGQRLRDQLLHKGEITVTHGDGLAAEAQL